MTQHRKIKPVTEEEYLKCNEWNRAVLEEFLMQPHFSKDTVKQYTSSGKIFLRFIYDRFQNKEIYKLKPRNGMMFQSWLDGLGLSPSAVRLRRSLVSTLCNYIELYYGEEEECATFRNIFPKGVAHVPLSYINDKEPLTVDEWNHLVKTLEEREEYQMKAYLLMSYFSGGRRSEICQLEKNIVTHEKVKGSNRYATNTVRGKGSGSIGKPFKLFFGDEVMDSLREWLEFRGEDEEASLFVRKLKDGSVYPLQREAFNDWCSTVFTPIVGKRITPHSLRRMRATHMDEAGVPIETIKRLLNHNSTETTSIYIIKDDDEGLDDADIF